MIHIFLWSLSPDSNSGFHHVQSVYAALPHRESALEPYQGEWNILPLVI